MANTAAVIGLGTMGSGIAQTAAQAGWDVRLFDPVAGVAQKGLESIRKSLKARQEKGRITESEMVSIMGRFALCETIQDACKGVDLVIEAIVEDLNIKRELFTSLGKNAPENAILATNTSSLCVTAIAASSGRPSHVVGMHFFNPAPVMKLVEVIRGDHTSAEAVQRTIEIARAWDKTPVVAKDTPGFIVNRVARNYYGESLRMLGENIADVETIDQIMSGVGGFKMGPFQLMDLVGIDVNLAVTKSVYHANFEEPRYRPHPIQQKMVDAGLLGKKSGKGFYSYGN